MDNIGNQIFIVHYKHEKKQKLYYYIQYLGGGLQYIWGGAYIWNGVNVSYVIIDVELLRGGGL